MRIFVDDLRDAPDDTWTVVRTTAEARAILSGGQVIDLSLDHDMGGDGYKDDGSALTYWLADTGNWPKNKPTIHSANPVGRAYMQGMIDQYGPY